MFCRRDAYTDGRDEVEDRDGAQCAVEGRRWRVLAVHIYGVVVDHDGYRFFPTAKAGVLLQRSWREIFEFNTNGNENVDTNRSPMSLFT